jgi:hypothetical protein
MLNGGYGQVSARDINEKLAYDSIPGSQQAANQIQQQPPQTVQAAQHFAIASERLKERVLMLHQRLEPVMRPSVPKAESPNKPEKRLGQAPIAELWNQATDRADEINYIIEEIINRLEI